MTVPSKLRIAGALAVVLVFAPGFGPLLSAQQPDGGEEEEQVQRQGRTATATDDPEAEGPPTQEEGETGETPEEVAAEAVAGDVETDGSEAWEDIAPGVYDSFEPVLPTTDDSAGPTVLAVQWMLERAGYGSGVLDGRWGSNTANALRAFQAAEGLETTGQADVAAWQALSAAAGDGTSPLAEHEVSAATVEGPFVEVPEDYVEQAELDCLCYESMAEALAEELHTTVEVLKLLNPDVDLASLEAGDKVVGLAVGGADAERGAGGEIASLLISKSDFHLRALDADGNVVYHFPTTVGAGYDPSPDGELTITAIATDPNFHYQPELFADVLDSKPDKMLPAGPNNPVGVVWMQLSEENYGIHGTAEPSTIGHSTSHGCIRLTNWDAAFLAERVGEGVPVRFTGGGAEEGGESETQ